MDDKGIECEGVVKDMVQWRAIVRMITNHAIHKNENFPLASQEPSSMEPGIRQLVSFIVTLKRLRRKVNTDIMSCVWCWSQPQCGFAPIDNGFETSSCWTCLLDHNLTAELGKMCWQRNNNLNISRHLLIVYAAQSRQPISCFSGAILVVD
jgi:hypothetical protein